MPEQGLRGSITLSKKRIFRMLRLSRLAGHQDGAAEIFGNFTLENASFSLLTTRVEKLSTATCTGLAWVVALLVVAARARATTKNFGAVVKLMLVSSLKCFQDTPTSTLTSHNCGRSHVL